MVLLGADRSPQFKTRLIVFQVPGPWLNLLRAALRPSGTTSCRRYER